MFNVFKSTLLSKQYPAASEFDYFLAPNNSGCLREFLVYSINEFSAENLLALLACLDYEKRATPEKRAFITAQFVAPGAQWEVNIQNKVRLALNTTSNLDLTQARYRQSRARTAIVPMQLPSDPNYFVNAKLVFALKQNILADTYPRFSLTLQKKLGQTYVGQVDFKPNTAGSRTEVTSLLNEMRRIGFQLSAKLLA